VVLEEEEDDLGNEVRAQTEVRYEVLRAGSLEGSRRRRRGKGGRKETSSSPLEIPFKN